MSDALMAESIAGIGRCCTRRLQAQAGRGDAIDNGHEGLGVPSDDDYRLLEEHGGIAALERAGLHGVADRLSFYGYPAHSDQVVKKDVDDV